MAKPPPAANAPGWPPTLPGRRPISARRPVLAARRVAPGGPRAPTAIISASPLPAVLAERADQLAERGAGLVVTGPGRPAASVTWRLGPSGMDVLGVAVVPHRLEPSTCAAIRGLVETAVEPGDVDATAASSDRLAAERAAVEGDGPITAEQTGVDAAAAAPPEPPAEPTGPELRLLGPVELAGGTASPRPRVLECLAYLSSHPAG